MPYTGGTTVTPIVAGGALGTHVLPDTGMALSLAEIWFFALLAVVLILSGLMLIRQVLVTDRTDASLPT